MSNDIQMIPLYSGSSGNAIFVQFEGTRILIDVGCSTKSVVEALEKVGQSPQSIDAILITHDHSDHIKGLDVFVRKYGVPTFATSHTWRGIHRCEKKPHPFTLDHTIVAGETFQIGGVTVLPFSTPHDANGSVGFRFTYKNIAMAVATDLGYFSDEVRDALIGCDAILIESNYDYEMLWTGPYPWVLKKRVDGKMGHLCNRDCAEAICLLYRNGTKHFVLGHLSQENNTPTTAKKEILAAMERIEAIAGDTYHLHVANRYTPSDPVILAVSELEEDQKVLLRSSLRENLRIEDLL